MWDLKILTNIIVIWPVFTARKPSNLYVRVTKTPADKVSFPLTEVVITPSAPLSIVVHFYPAVWRVSSSRQPELNILDTPCVNKCSNNELIYFNTTKGISVYLFVSLLFVVFSILFIECLMDLLNTTILLIQSLLFFFK